MGRAMDEATVNPDGSTTFDNAGNDAGIGDEEIIKGTDPAVYLMLGIVALIALFVFLQLRKKRNNADVSDFFANLDGEKFNLKLPAAVDEYYEVKEKCEDEGWEP